MYNANWPRNHNPSTSNVDWSALADTWMQQREQQAQWQQATLPPPPPPPPPPPQFLLGPPPVPPPIGMTFPPLPPTQIAMTPARHHQLQVGSNTTQESLTMSNIENAPWRPPLPLPLPPPMMMPGGPQWRSTMNSNPSVFPIQPEMPPPFGGHNFWPPNNVGQPLGPPQPPLIPPPPVPVPPPVLPPVPPQQKTMPSQFPSETFQHPPIEKRMMNTSFNSSIPPLMDLPPSFAQNPVPSSIPVPPVPILPMEPTASSGNKSGSGHVSTKRRKIPAWLREELGKIEKKKEKSVQNSSSNNNTNNLSVNDISSKFDDDYEEDDENETNNRTFSDSVTRFNEDEVEDDEDDDENDDEEPTTTTLVSSTPIVTRRSRFDDDKSTEPQLNLSAIPRRAPSPSAASQSTTVVSTFIEEDPVDKEEQFMIKLRRALTELLLEVTNEELASIAKEIYMTCKADLSTPVIRKASGLSSLLQSFSGTDSDEDDERGFQSSVNTTVIKKSPVRTPVRQDNVSTKSTSKIVDTDNKSSKSKEKKSTRDRSPSSSSSSHDHKSKKHHHKKHRRHSSSSSSNSSQSRSHKKKKSSNHDQYSEYSKSKKYDDQRRKR